jgi:PKD repeat protein
MSRTERTFIFMLVTVLFLRSFMAADWYVATNGNDSWAGTNWDTAFATVSNGVAHATNGQTVLVGTGTYSISEQISITTNLTLLSVGGATQTIVMRNPAYTNRILYINKAGAVVDGFSLTNGYWDAGAGVYLAAGTLRNCIVENNRSYDRGSRDFGAGIYQAGGLVSNCIFRGNRATGGYAKGGGGTITGGTMQQCVISNNWANENGGALCLAGSAARVMNCLIWKNGGAGFGNNNVFFYSSGGQLLNCTVCANTGRGVQIENTGTGGVISNTIVYFNSLEDIQAAYTDRYSYCCASNLTGGVGNMTNNPLFVDRTTGNLRLAAGSPCINTGISSIWMPTDTDLDGNLRIQHGAVDMGAYESPGGLGCNFVSDKTSGFASLTNVFTAYVSGTNVSGLYYWWDVNADGTVDQEGADKQIITNVYDSAGLYSVALMVSNDLGYVDAFTNVNYISVSLPTLYVSLDGSNILPYSSWGTAATTLQAAVSFAADGGTILISNGLYSLTNTISVSLATTLKSVNGAAATVIAGNGSKPCFSLNNAGAVLDGLTLSNGYSSLDGGGLTVSAGTVQNCVIRNNSASRYGGGAYLLNGSLKNCLIVRNTSIGNIAPLAPAAGGLYMTGGTVLHCTIADNTAVRGGANAGDGLVMSGGAVSNSIVYYNSLYPYRQTQRNVYKTGGTFVYSCTIPAIAGASNTVADPQFVNRADEDYRLLPGSPCIDRGTNIVGFITDLVGTNRPLDGDTMPGTVVDMGAYEAEPLTQGSLRCNFVASTDEGQGVLTNVVFMAYVGGLDTNISWYGWDFSNDGTNDLAGGGFNPVSNTFAVGFYTVRLTVTNGFGQGATMVRPACIRAASPILYVSPGGSATLPYDTWGKAATNLNAAVEAAYAVGCTQQVFVTNGQYGLDRQMDLLSPVVMTGLGGASNTMAYRTGAYVHRIAYLANAAAVLDGFTLTNGYENTAGVGGGVYMTAGTLRNCLVTKNTDVDPGSRPYGGGIYASGGTISDSIILANYSSGGYAKCGGVALAGNALMSRCVVDNNSANENGGGVGFVNGGKAVNCLITHNYAGDRRAIYIDRVASIVNCTIASNKVSGSSPAIGYENSPNFTVSNSIVYFNGGPDIVAGALPYFFYSCSPGLTDGVNGNITNAPWFVDRAAGDFRLQSRSPGLNVGHPLNWTRRDLDLDGNPRLAGGGVDMGAYERLFAGLVFIVK